MSKEKIKEVAIQHFTEYGYHGVRMAQIAVDAGLRKQTLAYYYSSKMKLYEEVYGDVVEEEIGFVRGFFLSNTQMTWDEQLYQFLIQHQERFLQNNRVNFMFVTSFLPPAEGYDYIIVEYRRYLKELKEEVARLFSQDQRIQLTPEECTVIYVTLMDGLDVQLVYEKTKSYEQMLKLTWSVLLNGIRR